MKFNNGQWVSRPSGGQPCLGGARGRKMSRCKRALEHHAQRLCGRAATWSQARQWPGNRPVIFQLRFSKNDGFSLNAVDMPSTSDGRKPMGFGYTSNSCSARMRLRQRRQYYCQYPSSLHFLRTRWAMALMEVGVFDTIIGYESTSSPLDPNYTRSYAIPWSRRPIRRFGHLQGGRRVEHVCRSGEQCNNVESSPTANKWDFDLRVAKDLHGSIVLTARIVSVQ